LKSPLARGAILADEVGLGKTIEAGLVIAQRWAERRRRILLIVPASLRKQWAQELQSKFSLPSFIIEAKSHRELRKQGRRHPFDHDGTIVIASYEFAARQADEIGAIAWDLVVFDEAHRLRNVYKASGSRRAKDLKRALQERFKLLLTATPLQNSLMELYGLVSVVDEHVFGDEFAFKTSYMGRNAGGANLLMLRDRLKPVCRRTLRKEALEAGHISYTQRNAITAKFEPNDREHELYELVSTYLQREDTVLFGEKPNPLVTLVTTSWYESEERKLTQYADDLEKSLDVEIADIEAEMEELTKRSREPGLALAEKVALRREAQKKEERREELIRQRFDRKKQIRETVNAMLDKVLDSLKLEPEVAPLFTVRWELGK
jgi:SNF2 family DNA or RNA helicase